MKPGIHGIAVCALLTIGLFSCDKEDTAQPYTPVAGKGGNATLRIIPQNKGVDVDSCLVYIKYNTLDIPMKYDDSVWVTRKNMVRPTGTFSGLNKGNYYIWAKGWDIKTSEHVSGGIAHTITDNNATTYIELVVHP